MFLLSMCYVDSMLLTEKYSCLSFIVLHVKTQVIWPGTYEKRSYKYDTLFFTYIICQRFNIIKSFLRVSFEIYFEIGSNLL